MCLIVFVTISRMLYFYTDPLTKITYIDEGGHNYLSWKGQYSVVLLYLCWVWAINLILTNYGDWIKMITKGGWWCKLLLLL